MIAVADQVGTEVVTAGATYFALDAQLHLGRLRDLLERGEPAQPLGAHRARRAVRGLVEEHRRLTIQALRAPAGARARAQDDGGRPMRSGAVLALAEGEVAGFARWQRLLAELDSQSSADLAMLSVAVRALVNGLDSRQAA